MVFDSDMRANPNFLLKTLEVMADSSLSLVLTPQAFHNINILSDLFNSNNRQFWEYWLPGAAAWGYVACTGTNFMIRAASLASCGWFPVSTITEDYALGMELKKRGHKATYLMEYLSVGEAPEAPRQVFQQRSRWTKGHYQVRGHHREHSISLFLSSPPVLPSRSSSLLQIHSSALACLSR